MIRKVTADDIGKRVFWAPDGAEGNRPVVGLLSQLGTRGVIISMCGDFPFRLPANECFIEIAEVKPIETPKFVVEVDLDYADSGRQNGVKVREALMTVIRTMPLNLSVPGHRGKQVPVRDNDDNIIATWTVV